MLWRRRRFLQTLDQRGLVGLQVARQARRLCLGFDNVLEYALKYSIDEERFTFRSRCHLASRDRSLRPLPPSGTVSARCLFRIPELNRSGPRMASYLNIPKTLGVHGQHFRIFRRTKFRYTPVHRSEEHTSELQSLMRISYAVLR